MSFVCVGLGGGLGAVCRYLISLIPVKSDFPFLTLITNLLGAVIIGVIAGVAGKSENMSKNFNLFLRTGFCGGFTTFSTFSLETFNLFEKNEYFLGSLYAVLSLVLCLAGVYCGKLIAEKALPGLN